MRPGPACVVPFNDRVRGSGTINRLIPSSVAQHPIVDGKNDVCDALQALVYEVVLWWERGP